MRSGFRLRLLAATLALLPALAAAHDTWFARLPNGQLALGTGNRFPVQETGLTRQALVVQGCRDASGAVRPLRPRQEGQQALALAVPKGRAVHTCWAQTAALDITLSNSLVLQYLDEIRAPEPVRQRWEALAARGVVWQERYAKHARVALDADGGAGVEVPMAMDIVPLAPIPAAGGEFSVTVLHGGQALPSFNLELIHADTGAGFWLRTDQAGQVRLHLALPGAWLLRGTELRPHPEQADAWDSRFVTLALQVAPPGKASAHAAAPYEEHPRQTEAQHAAVRASHSSAMDCRLSADGARAVCRP